MFVPGDQVKTRSKKEWFGDKILGGVVCNTHRASHTRPEASLSGIVVGSWRMTFEGTSGIFRHDPEAFADLDRLQLIWRIDRVKQHPVADDVVVLVDVWCDMGCWRRRLDSVFPVKTL